MDDISPIGGVGIGGLLMGVVALLYRFLGQRTDPRLLDLMQTLIDTKKQDQTDRSGMVKTQERLGLLIERLEDSVSNQMAKQLESNTGLRIENVKLQHQVEFVTKAQEAMRHDLAAQKEATEKQHSLDTAEIVRLREQLTETEAALMIANEDREAMEIRVCTLEEDNTRLREQNAAMEKRMVEVESQMAKINNLLEKEISKREKAEAEVATLKRRVVEQDALLVEKDAEIDRLRGVNATLMKNAQTQTVQDKEKKNDGNTVGRLSTDVPAGGGGHGSGGEVRDEGGTAETV